MFILAISTSKGLNNDNFAGSIFLVDTFGRRPLLMASGLIMSLSCGGLGVYFVLDPATRSSLGGLDWVPLASLVLFMVGYSVGFASVPFVLMGEMLPARFRNALGAIASSFNLTNTFLVIKVKPNFTVSGV